MPVVATRVAVTLAETGLVVIEKVAEVAPAATVTVVGTVALELFDVRPMDVPPGPAGPFRVTVPVDGVPPATVLGVAVNVVTVAGLIVKIAV